MSCGVSSTPAQGALALRLRMRHMHTLFIVLPQLDVAALDAQVAEKRAREAAEREADRAYGKFAR